VEREFREKLYDPFVQLSKSQSGPRTNLECYIDFLRKNEKKWVIIFCTKNFVGTFKTTGRNESGNGLIKKMIKKPKDLIKVVEKSVELTSTVDSFAKYHTVDEPPTHPFIIQIKDKIANVIYRKIFVELKRSSEYHAQKKECENMKDSTSNTNPDIVTLNLQQWGVQYLLGERDDGSPYDFHTVTMKLSPVVNYTIRTTKLQCVLHA